jgi:Uri superfamily endonuclease
MNNLEKRVQRHLRKEKKFHWHIDYLTTWNFVKIQKVYIRESDRKEECLIAEIVSKYGIPIAGFGSSDCRCISHFYKVSDYIFLEGFMRPENPAKYISSQ